MSLIKRIVRLEELSGRIRSRAEDSRRALENFADAAAAMEGVRGADRMTVPEAESSTTNLSEMAAVDELLETSMGLEEQIALPDAFLKRGTPPKNEPRGSNPTRTKLATVDVVVLYEGAFPSPKAATFGELLSDALTL